MSNLLRAFFSYYLRFWPMGWQCKICKALSATKGNLLKHYRLQHATFGRGLSQPCLCDRCPCTFKTQSALRTHLSRYHAPEESLQPGIISAFKCLVCNACCSTFSMLEIIWRATKRSFVYLKDATLGQISTIHFWNTKAEDTDPILWVILSRTCIGVTIIRLLTILIYQRPVMVRPLV